MNSLNLQEGFDDLIDEINYLRARNRALERRTLFISTTIYLMILIISTVLVWFMLYGNTTAPFNPTQQRNTTTPFFLQRNTTTPFNPTQAITTSSTRPTSTTTTTWRPIINNIIVTNEVGEDFVYTKRTNRIG